MFPKSSLKILSIVCAVFLGFLTGTIFPQNLEQTLQQHDPSSGPVVSQPQSLPIDSGKESWGSKTAEATTSSPTPAKYTLAVISDLHVRKGNMASLKKAVETVNSLPEVSSVAILGDICEKVGSARELNLAADLVKTFSDPVMAVPGNHDFIYKDEVKKNGKKERGTKAGQKQKLENFKDAFGQKGIRFSRKVGGHLLVFLPIDARGQKPLAQLSKSTLEFFAETLQKNPKLPTIVFCHAPLEGSYEREGGLKPIHANVQPADDIETLLRKNPQVFLWCAGHLHIKPSSNDFTSKANKVGKVTVIHVPNVTESSGWARILELSPEAAIVRTCDLRTGKFIKKHERTFQHINKGSPSPGTNPSQQTSTSSGTSTSTGTQARPLDNDSFMNRIEKLIQRLEAILAKLKGS